MALHTRVNCQHQLRNGENSGGSRGVSTVGLFETEPNLDFLKNREDLMPLSLYTMTLSGKDFIRLFQRKTWASYLRCA
jgi:hypothetical protein